MSKNKYLAAGLFLIINTISIVNTQQPLIPFGSQQSFELLNLVQVNNAQQTQKNELNYAFKANLLINSVWHGKEEQLLEVILSNPTVNFASHTQNLVKLSDRPFYISLKNGIPSQVLAILQRDQTLLNLQKAIASLLLIQYTDSPVAEIDVSGRCSTFYAFKSSTKIIKTKTDCSNWDLRVRYRVEKAFSVLQNSTQQTIYDLTADGTLLKATTIENHAFTLAAKPDVGHFVNSQFVLRHLAQGNEPVEQFEFETLQAATDSLLNWYKVYELTADVDGSLADIKDKTLAEYVAEMSEQLDTEAMGTKDAALALAKLLPIARFTKKTEFIAILNKHKTLHPQLMDLLGSVQTIDAHNAINKVFDYNNDADWEMLEKYLQTLSIGTFAERAIVVDLFERLSNTQLPINNDKLRDSILQTIAALTKRSTFDVNDELLKSIRSYILNQFNNNCTDTDCKVLQVRALQNLNDFSTIPKLLKIALTAEKAISVAAMQALKSFPHISFTQKQRKILWSIFYQRTRKFDSTARTFALDILLSSKPALEELEHLLKYLHSNDTQYEVKTFVIQKLNMLSQRCYRFKAMFSMALRDNAKANNYDVLAQKGLSTVLMRTLSIEPAFNESLLSVQEIQSGVLKRGSVDLLLQAANEETSTFKLGIYTNGLNSFVSDNSQTVVEDDVEEEDSTATAGMEISVQGVLLRPLVFFIGQTELMGYVWSGTASEPTMAYLATVVEHDFEHFVVLSSGISVHAQVLGARSADLNGQVELSIWNRNAQVKIEHNTGVAIVGKLTVGWTNCVQLEQSYNLITEPSLRLQTDADFYSTIKLCMQLQRPRNVLTLKNINKVSLLPAKKVSKTLKTKQEYISQGKTLALNQKNNEMCNLIFKNEQ